MASVMLGQTAAVNAVGAPKGVVVKGAGVAEGTDTVRNTSRLTCVPGGAAMRPATESVPAVVRTKVCSPVPPGKTVP